MALAIDVNVSADVAPISAGTLTSPSFSTSTASELLIALVYSSCSKNVSSISWSGTGPTWTKVTSNFNSGAGDGCVDIWQATATSIVSSQTVTAHLSASSSSQGGSISILSFTGASGVGASNTALGNATASAPSVSVTTTAASSYVVGCGASAQNNYSLTTANIPSGQTSIHLFNDSAEVDTNWAQRTTNTVAAGSTTLNITGKTMQWWIMGAVEVKASGGTTFTSTQTAALSILTASALRALRKSEACSAAPLTGSSVKGTGLVRFASTYAPTAAVARATAKPLNSTTALESAATSKSVQRTIAANCGSFSATASRTASRLWSALTQTRSALLAKGGGKSLLGSSLAPSGSISRQSGKLASATQTPSAAATGKQIAKIVLALQQTASALTVRQTGKQSTSQTLPTAGALFRRWPSQAFLAGLVSAGAILVRLATKGESANTLSHAATQSKQPRKTENALASALTASTAHQAGKILACAMSSEVASLTRRALKSSVAASLVPVAAALSRYWPQTLSATIASSTVAFVRRIGNAQAANTATQSVNQSKQLGKSLGASTGLSATAVRQISRGFAAVSSACTASLSSLQAFLQNFSARLATVSGKIGRATSTTLTADSLPAGAAISRNVSKAFVASTTAISGGVSSLKAFLLAFSGSLASISGKIVRSVARANTAQSLSGSAATNRSTAKGFTATPAPAIASTSKSAFLRAWLAQALPLSAILDAVKNSSNFAVSFAASLFSLGAAQQKSTHLTRSGALASSAQIMRATHSGQTASNPSPSGMATKQVRKPSLAAILPSNASAPRTVSKLSTATTTLHSRLGRGIAKAAGAVLPALNGFGGPLQSFQESFVALLSRLSAALSWIHTALTGARRFVVPTQQRSWTVTDDSIRDWAVAQDLARELTVTVNSVRSWIIPSDSAVRAWQVIEGQMIYTEKDPHSTEDFQLDWTQVLSANNDTIASSTWTVPSGLTLVSNVNAATTATARIGGGTLGQIYTVANIVTLASGQVKAENLRITIKLA